MKHVWLTASTYEELNNTIMARRLYQSDVTSDNPRLTFKLNRLFAKGYQIIKERYPNNDDLLETVRSVEEYSSNLKRFGLKDYSIRSSSLKSYDFIKQSLLALSGLIVCFIVSLPDLILTLTLGYFIGKYAKE